jgi:hypothetical protein
MKFQQLIFSFFILFICIEGLSQNTFPASWEGNYKGELQIFGVDSVTMKVEMKLDIVKKTTSSFQWKISYNFKGNEDVRDYELKIIDAEKGMYVIDEKNSIVIESYYKMETFTSFFKVMDSFIVSTYTKKADAIVFEIISGDENNLTISGDKKINEEEIPKVTSYLVNGRQKAILIKQ